MEEMEVQAATTNEGEETTQAVETASTEQSQEAPETDVSGEQEVSEGAPEQYQDFTAPEGRQFDPDFVKAYSDAAKELNLSQDKAQLFLDKVAPVVVARQQAQMTEMIGKWEQDSTTDKEFGGDKLQENLGMAKQALDKFGTPELKQLMQQSGLGNHPEIIRFFYRAGKAIAPDTIVTGQATAGKGQPKSFNDFADKLYS